jgi:dTDP-4-dehydrorhamnose reductase
MKALVLGASGLLGQALIAEWRVDTIIAPSHASADICHPEQIAAIVGAHNPDWIVLAAAYTDVDGCESNRELAFRTNAEAPVNVARIARDHNARLMLLSTDYVFDGRKSIPYETEDAYNPKSVYGQTKMEAEIGVQAVLPGACIVRTSWVFGVGGKCFPDTILKAAAARPELAVVNDQRGSPTYTRDLARAIVNLCRIDAKGIVHAANAGDCTWFDFASAIVSRAGLRTSVRPTTSDQFVRPAPRPAYSVLSPLSLHRLGITMPAWEDALGRYLLERSQPGLAGPG